MKRIILTFALFFSATGYVFAQATADQYLAAGNQFYIAKNYPQALQYYQAAVQLNPNSSAANQGLGNCYYVQGQKDQALGAYQKALALDPNNTQLAAFVQALEPQVQNTAPALPASTSASPASNFKPHLYLGARLGGLIPASGFGSEYSFGFGLGLSLGYALDPNFSILLSTAGYILSTSYPGVSAEEAEFVPSVQYAFGNSGIQPYVKVGLGLNTTVVVVNPYSFSQSNPMFQIGGGVLIPAGTGLNLFFEIKYSDVFASGGGISYIPIDGGLNFDL
jgi:hypothetical protein